jgi:hypothetical protein
MNTTAKFAKIRNAAMLVLAFGIAAAGAYPVQAAILEKPIEGKDHYDCLSRQEVKWEFKQEGLKNVNVSRTHDDYIYRVTGYAYPKKEAAMLGGSENLLVEKQSSEKVRYVFLYDACDHRVIEQLSPSP